MAPSKASDSKVAVGNIREVDGEVNIAGRDIYKGFTAEQVTGLLDKITFTFQPKKFDGRCPYKGLDVFEEEDAELFFGRERLVDELVARVKESRTAFITGPSGSGKSSLVGAGLIHALKQGAIRGSDRWLYETIKPGRDPFEALALAFSRLKSPELAKYFQEHNTEIGILNQCAESVLSGRNDQRFVLFIDQFEEVFTQVSPEKAEAFINVLTYAATVENGRAIVLFAMRSDFVSNCATYPQLNDLLNQQFLQVGSMQPHELVNAIAQPTLRVGLRIDPDFIAQIIRDTEGEPGTLPLMQFALKDLFDSQEKNGGVIALTLEDYLERGGIHKALERHADESFSKLDKNEQELARSIFGGLIEIGRGTQDTRRTALFDELIPAISKPEDVKAIVQKLADARLVTTDEQAGKEIITLAHETLIDAWPWLKKVVNENRDVIALQNEIAEDAKIWEEHGRDSSYLYSGARLINANEQLKSSKLVLSGIALEYIQLGQSRQQQSRLALIGAVSTVIILLIVAVIVFRNQSARNAQLAQEALARQLAAQAQSIYATKNSNQMISALLSIQSLKLFTTEDAASFLRNDNLAALPVARMTHGSIVSSVAFSPDGRYVVSGGYDRTARVWEVATGKEVARMTYGSNAHSVSVAFSPDGRYVVSAGCNTFNCTQGSARVWEAMTGEEMSRMTFASEVYSVAFSPDGRYVVSGGCDKFESGSCTQGSARVWKAVTGDEVARLTHDGRVSSVAFSPDGKYVVSSGCEKVEFEICTQGSARVWEALTGEEVARMTHDGGVSAVSFSLDGRYMVSGGCDKQDTNLNCTQGSARVWEIATGQEVARMIHDHYVNSVAFSPDGRYVVSGSADDTARVWEVATGQEVARMIHNDAVWLVAFSPDGQYVVSVSVDDTARVWETATGVEVARMTHDYYINSVAFSPDGRYLATGSADHTVRVWEEATNRQAAQMTYVSGVRSVAFSPDGQYVVSSGCDKEDMNFVFCRQNSTRVWKFETGEEVARLTNNGRYADIVSFSPDGRYLVSGSDDGTVRVWEITTGRDVARMMQDGSMSSMAFSPDGRYVVSGGCDKFENGSCPQSSARVWEVATGEEVTRMTYDYLLNSVAFSPDGQYVISSGCDKFEFSSCTQDSVRVREITTGKEVAHMTHYGEIVVALSPDGRYGISESDDGTVRVWEITTGKEVVHMTHNDRVSVVAFSPDGRYVISGSDDGTVRVWKATTGREVAHMTHNRAISAVAFSPDGRYVASGSDDGTARVWVVATGNEVARMTHDDSVFSVVFSPDSQYVASGSGDGSVRVWVWQPANLIANACASMPRNLTRAEWARYIGDVLPYQAVCENLPIESEPSATP